MPTHGADASAPALRVFMLGGFRVERDDDVILPDQWPRRAARQLLKCLLTRRTRRLPRDEAYELFWPKSDPEAAATTLRGTVLVIRRLLEPGVNTADSILVVDPDTIVLRREAGIWVDADAFERLLAEARRSDQPDELLEQADQLYAGEYLPDDLYDDWATQRREALHNLWTELQFDLARVRERRGDVKGAILALQRLLEHDRCDERAASELMRLLARHGRRSDALRVFQRLSDSLRDELDAEPSPETVEVHRQVTAGEIPPAHPPGAEPGSGGPAITPAAQRGRRAGSPLAAGERPSPDASARPPFEPTYPFPTPDVLVGRHTALGAAHRVLERGLSAGQTMLIGATAGTGKSAFAGRIVAEAQAMGYLCLAGGSFDQESPAPYGPIRDALCDYLLAQPPEQLRLELPDLLPDLEPIVPELRYHLPEARDWPARPPDPSRLLAAVHGCLRALAARQPVLFCLEDLHAADGATVQLLHYLARQTRRLRLVLVGTYRSDELQENRPLARLVGSLGRDGLAQEIRLDPLGHEETDALLASLLDGMVSDDLTDTLFGVTEGNPLFVEQLVLALHEEARIHQRDGVWYQAAIDDAPLPPLVMGVIERRFERLAPAGRAVLAMAAVLGQTFELAPLVAALGWGDHTAVIALLQEATDAQLVRETASGYRFGHAMIREALYRGLRGLRRASLHAQAGEAIERLAGTRVMERSAELALHFSVASETAPTGEANVEKALRYSLEAGRRAASLSAHREALAHFARACALIERHGDGGDMDRRIAALEGRGAAERDLGLWSQAIETFRQVLELTSDPRRRAGAHAAIGRAHQQITDMPEALGAFDAGLAELDRAAGGAEPPETASIRLDLIWNRAFAQLIQGRLLDAQRAGEQILAAGRRADRSDLRYRGHLIVALALMWAGRVDEAIEHHGLALQTAEPDGNKIHLAAAYENFGTQLYFAGLFAQARSNVERAISYYREAAGERRTVLACQRLSRIWLAEGDLGRAYEQAERGRVLALEVGDRWSAECYAALGAVFIARAAWADAEACYQRALGVQQRVGHLVGATDSLLGLGLVHERRGNWPPAEEQYRCAVDVAAQMDPGLRTVAAIRHLGRLLLRQGRRREAATLIEQAVAFAEQMPRTLEYATTLLVQAELLRQHAPDEATRLLERALDAATTMESWIEGGAQLVALYLRAGADDLAARRVAAIVPAAEQMGAPYELGLARRAAGRLAAARGDLTTAEQSLRAALEQFETAQIPYERAITLDDLADVLARSSSDGRRALALRQEAVGLWRQLRAARSA